MIVLVMATSDVVIVVIVIVTDGCYCEVVAVVIGMVDGNIQTTPNNKKTSKTHWQNNKANQLTVV